MKTPNQLRSHFLQFAIMIPLIVILAILFRLAASRITPAQTNNTPASVGTVNDSWRLIVADDDSGEGLQTNSENSSLVPLTINVFNDLNLDGIQGDPEQEGNQVLLYNVQDYNDRQYFAEELITNDRVKLCYGIVCKKPDENGQIIFQIPRVIFEQRDSIELTYDYRPWRYVYYTFNDPFTIHGSLENGNIILSPQYQGSGDINLPTNRNQAEFTIGFSQYPCVLPFDESVVDELLPMNFFDFDHNMDSIVNFDGKEPRRLRDIDPAFGNYYSENHAGFDFYYPRKDKVIRYSCVLSPHYLRNSSSDEFGNLVYTLKPTYESGEFLIGYGHVDSPSALNNPALDMTYGEAFATVGDKGSSINHLHLAMGDFTEYRKGGSTAFCAIPLFPYIAGDTPFPGEEYGISQLGEELCFDNQHRTYLSFVQDGLNIYAPFIPAVDIGQNSLSGD